jgi:hypothetical protein
MDETAIRRHNVTSFFANLPVWVLPLFVGLMIVSLRATRSRRVPKLLIYSLPLLGLLSFRTVLSFDLYLLALAVFAIGYASGARLGFLAQAKWITSITDRHVTIQGESLTLVTIMGLFILNFVHGAVNGIAQELATSATYVVALSTIAGGLSGTFLGRALRVATMETAPA